MRFIDKYPQLLKDQSLTTLLVQMTYATMDLENQRVDEPILKKMVKKILQESPSKAT